MPAYVIVRTNVSDPAPMAEYRAAVPALIEKHGGRYISRGAPLERFEGNDELTDAVVIIEFPSAEHAKAWHADPDYAPYIELRQSGAHSEMILVAGT